MSLLLSFVYDIYSNRLTVLELFPLVIEDLGVIHYVGLYNIAFYIGTRSLNAYLKEILCVEDWSYCIYRRNFDLLFGKIV